MKRALWMAPVLLAAAVGAAQANELYAPWAQPGTLMDSYPGIVQPVDARGGHPMRRHPGGTARMERQAILASLPAEKQEAVRKLRVTTRQSALTKRAELKSNRLALRELMRAYPLDAAAARKRKDAIAAIQADLFALRVTSQQQMQQIVGKDVWGQLHPALRQGGPRMRTQGRVGSL